MLNYSTILDSAIACSINHYSVTIPLIVYAGPHSASGARRCAAAVSVIAPTSAVFLATDVGTITKCFQTLIYYYCVLLASSSLVISC